MRGKTLLLISCTVLTTNCYTYKVQLLNKSTPVKESKDYQVNIENEIGIIQIPFIKSLFEYTKREYSNDKSTNTLIISRIRFSSGKNKEPMISGFSTVFGALTLFILPMYHHWEEHYTMTVTDSKTNIEYDILVKVDYQKYFGWLSKTIQFFDNSFHSELTLNEDQYLLVHKIILSSIYQRKPLK